MQRSKYIELLVEFGELAIGFLLALLIFLGILAFSRQLVLSVWPSFFLSTTEIHRLLDFALLIFITIELFRITIAYITARPVVKEVFIAALVAVGRKVVLYEYPVYGLTGAAALALLILAVSVGYYLICRGEPS